METLDELRRQLDEELAPRVLGESSANPGALDELLRREGEFQQSVNATNSRIRTLALKIRKAGG